MGKVIESSLVYLDQLVGLLLFLIGTRSIDTSGKDDEENSPNGNPSITIYV